MQFSIGHVLAALDKTLLNPFLSALVPLYLQFFTENKLIFTPSSGILPYSLQTPLPPILYKALVLFGLGFTLRVNRFLSARALNNGVTAKFDWKKEIVVVTGASGGIGAEAAKMIADRGTKVVVVDVIPLTYEKPANLYYYKCDLTNFEEVKKTAATITKEVGAPTCVVANAGICRGKTIMEASQRDIELTYGVNNLGLMWTIKSFLPNMIEKNHGHFLIIASQTGYLSTSGVVDYSSSKAATIGIYEGLHTECKHNYKAPAVRVSCISPSAVKTKMFDGIKGDSNFFLPRLDATDLGSLIVDILWSGKATNVMTPALAYISVPTKLLPEWLRVAMQDAGADIMTELKPHKPLN